MGIALDDIRAPQMILHWDKEADRPWTPYFLLGDLGTGTGGL